MTLWALVFPVLPLGAQQGSAATLEAQLQMSISAFTQGDYRSAQNNFAELERVFGKEPEYLDGSVQRVITPMEGYAALVSGDADEAIRHFEQYLSDFGKEETKKYAFVLFTLAQAHQQAGDIDHAVKRYGEFVQEFPDTPEAGIAYLRVGELQYERGDAEAALDTLDRFFTTRQAFTMREQGRLRALQIATESDLMERAVGYLLETPWELDRMPELAVLAFLALPLGDYLLGEERYDEAIEAYRLVPSQEFLIARQEERLEATRRTLEQRSRYIAADEAGIWREYYRGLVARLEAVLQQIKESEPYTGSLYLRYAQAFVQAGRHYEAWTVYESVAEDSAFDQILRQEAHYRLVIEAQTLERWQDTLRFAFSFVDRYPEAPQAPMVLFFTANAYQQIREYEQAVAILTRLLEEYPGHPFYSRWVFTRGFNQLLLEENALARNDFGRYLEDYPGTNLATNAALWHAVSWFFDKQYDEALSELDVLVAETPTDHYLRPEMEYRRGAVLYARRAYEPALEQLDHYLERYPEHDRREEALVLRGDSLMGIGQLLPAALAFRQVGPDAGGLFIYAVFQTGKIYRAMEEYERMAAHFTEYVSRTDLELHPRVSEGLYWIGWAREQQGRLDEAFPLFEEALERYGNDPEATEMMAILGALHQAHTRLRRNPPEGGIDSSSELLGTPDFMDWLGGEWERALDEEQFTYYSRLRLYEADRLENARRAAEAEQILADLGDTVPVEALDADGLGKVGLVWEERGREGAEVFFHAQLERYPNAVQRAYAFLGLGRLAIEAEDYAAAVEYLRPLVETMLTHPLGPEGAILYAQALVQTGDPAAAQPVLEDLLKLRSARGRPHARALLTLGQAAEARDEPDQAIAYYQRVYNLYRAYPELVGEAYLRSARLFEARGDLPAAWRTYREVVFFDELTDEAVRTEAQAELDRLTPLVPENEREIPEAVVAEDAATPTSPAETTTNEERGAGA